MKKLLLALVAAVLLATPFAFAKNNEKGIHAVCNKADARAVEATGFRCPLGGFPLTDDEWLDGRRFR